MDFAKSVLPQLLVFCKGLIIDRPSFQFNFLAGFFFLIPRFAKLDFVFSTTCLTFYKRRISYLKKVSYLFCIRNHKANIFLSPLSCN